MGQGWTAGLGAKGDDARGGRAAVSESEALLGREGGDSAMGVGGDVGSYPSPAPDRKRRPDVALALEAVTFRYAAGFGCGPVTLAVRRGEMAALLGPNGSGKSTLLKLMAGVLRPERGGILLEGAPLTALAPRERARRLAVVPQDVAVPAGYSVRDVVGFGRTAHAPLLAGLRAADRHAIERALALTETAALAGRQFWTLSGGERQRALLAMALAQGPALLLLDEPTAHLDVHYAVEMLDLLHRLHAAGDLTLLVTLHDLNLASLYFPRLLPLSAGHLAADGPPAAVLRPEVLGPVFGRRLALLRHPTRGLPLVVPEPGDAGEVAELGDHPAPGG